MTYKLYWKEVYISLTYKHCTPRVTSPVATLSTNGASLMVCSEQLCIRQ